MDYLDIAYNKNQIEFLIKKFAQFNLKSEKDFYEKFYEVFQLDYRIVYKNTNWKKLYNCLLYKYYRNEYVIKREFVRQKLNTSSAVCFEELPISRSRIDLFSINGKSIAYEIKTKYDKLDRIKKQVNDYSKCFEFVYVICPYEKLDAIKKLVPKHIGIYCYRSVSNTINFRKNRNAMYSPILKTSCMLSNLTPSELLTTFGVKKVDTIKKIYTPDMINRKFKKVLKRKYTPRSDNLKKEISRLFF